VGARARQTIAPVTPQVLEIRAKVFSALRHLGFREGAVRAAMEPLRGEVFVGRGDV